MGDCRAEIFANFGNDPEDIDNAATSLPPPCYPLRAKDCRDVAVLKKGRTTEDGIELSRHDADL